MEQLTDALQREQTLLELLLFKLTETRLLIDAGELRFVSWSAREVNEARQRARSADFARAAVVAGCAPKETGDGESTLRELAADATEPWAGMLRDHHEAMGALVAEIEMAAHLNAGLARDGLLGVQTRLEEPNGTSLKITKIHQGSEERLVLVTDDAAYRSVLGSADSLRMPALLAFLR